jgi:hypothetical protein
MDEDRRIERSRDCDPNCKSPMAPRVIKQHDFKTHKDVEVQATYCRFYRVDEPGVPLDKRRYFYYEVPAPMFKPAIIRAVNRKAARQIALNHLDQDYWALGSLSPRLLPGAVLRPATLGEVRLQAPEAWPLWEG